MLTVVRRLAGLLVPALAAACTPAQQGPTTTDAASTTGEPEVPSSSSSGSPHDTGSTSAGASSGAVDSTSESEGSTSEGEHVREHLLLEAGFEGPDPFAAFANEQHCCDHSVTQSMDQARTGTHSFRAEVRPDDPAVSAGWRAELVPASVSDTGLRWYGWSMYFEAPQAGGSWTGSYGGHFVQWHPDNSGGSASLALWGSDGIWDVATNPEGDGSADHHGSLPITANTWHDVVFRVDWDAGEVTFWLDGEVYVDLTGVDYASGPGQYMKLGMNRWGDGPGGAPEDTWIIYYDDLRIGDDQARFEDVAP